MRGQGFGGNQGLFFGGAQKQVAAVGRLIAIYHFRFARDGFAAFADDDIGRVQQIGADVLHGVFFRRPFDVGIVEQVFRARVPCRLPESDDDAMHGGFAAGLAGPLEGAVGEMDFYALRQQAAPQGFHLLPLGDGIGGDESSLHFGISADDAGGFDVPVGYVIQDARVFQAA